MKKKWIKTKKSELEDLKNIPKKALNVHESNENGGNDKYKRKSYEEIILAETADKIYAIQNRKKIENDVFRCPFCDAMMNVYECKGENTFFIQKECSNHCFESIKAEKIELDLEAYLTAKRIAEWGIKECKTKTHNIIRKSYGWIRVAEMNDKYIEFYYADLEKIKMGLIEEISDYTKELGKKAEELREMYGF